MTKHQQLMLLRHLKVCLTQYEKAAETPMKADDWYVLEDAIIECKRSIALVEKMPTKG